MRKFLLLAVLLLSSYGAWANVAASGWCEEGAQVVLTSGLASANEVQGSFPQCLVTVYPTGSSTPVPSNQIYSNNLPSPTVLGNPFTANTNGWWQFYAASCATCRYDIVLSGAGFASPFTISDVSLFDPATGSVATATTASNLAAGTYNYGSGSVIVNANTATTATTATHALNLPADYATQSAVTPAAAYSTNAISCASPLFDIRCPSFAGGASTSTSDNGPAIRAAVAATIAAHGELFIPCGIWNISTPADSSNYAAIGIYPGDLSIKIRTPGNNCAAIQYTGTTNIGSVIEVAPSKPPTLLASTGSFGGGFVLEDLMIAGNANVTHGLTLIEQEAPYLRSVDVKNVTTNAFNFLAVVGGQVDVPISNGTYNNLIANTLNSTNGIVLDGFSSIAEHTTTLIINSPQVAVHSGKALWSKYTQNVTWTNCQVGDNVINYQVDGSGDLALNCLFEDGGSPYANGTVVLNGNQNKIDAGTIGPNPGQTVLIIAGNSNIIDGVEIYGNISNTGKGSVLRGLYFAGVIPDTSINLTIEGLWGFSGSILASNVPLQQHWTANDLTASYGGSPFNPVGTASGTWVSGNTTTPVNIFTTNQFTPGKAWTASLVGSLLTLNSGYYPSALLSSQIFLTDTYNTISDGTNTCTFSVNGSGQFQMLANNSSGCGFTGTVIFSPLSTTAAGSANHITPLWVAPGAVSGTGYAACVRSLGPPISLGICSSVVGVGGTCTCN